MKKLFIISACLFIFFSCDKETDQLTKGEENALALRSFLNEHSEINTFFSYAYNHSSGDWDRINFSSYSVENKPSYKIQGAYFSFQTVETLWENLNLEYLVRYEQTETGKLNLYFAYPK